MSVAAAEAGVGALVVLRPEVVCEVPEGLLEPAAARGVGAGLVDGAAGLVVVDVDD